MKWKNAVEFPNNPYSAEALKRRLSQTSSNKFTDLERLANKLESHNDTNTEPNTKAIITDSSPIDKPITVILSLNKLSPERFVNTKILEFLSIQAISFIFIYYYLYVYAYRYGRDYYINDAKFASGSRSQKTCADLNLHRSIDDTDAGDVNHLDDDGDSVSDLDRIFNRSDNIQSKYRYAHSPTPSTLRLKSSLLLPNFDLKRSQSVCSVRSYGMRKRNCLKHRYNSKINTNSEDDGDDCSVDSLRILAEAQSHDQYSKNQQHHQQQQQQYQNNKYQSYGMQTIAQLERNALHRDIRRYSFSSRRGTKNFVINPLYDER